MQLLCLVLLVFWQIHGHYSGLTFHFCLNQGTQNFLCYLERTNYCLKSANSSLKMFWPHLSSMYECECLQSSLRIHLWWLEIWLCFIVRCIGLFYFSLNCLECQQTVPYFEKYYVALHNLCRDLGLAQMSLIRPCLWTSAWNGYSLSNLWVRLILYLPIAKVWLKSFFEAMVFYSRSFLRNPITFPCQNQWFEVGACQ